MLFAGCINLKKLLNLNFNKMMMMMMMMVMMMNGPELVDRKSLLYIYITIFHRRTCGESVQFRVSM